MTTMSFNYILYVNIKQFLTAIPAEFSLNMMKARHFGGRDPISLGFRRLLLYLLNLSLQISQHFFHLRLSLGTYFSNLFF